MNNQGFTLLELMIVVAVIGIIATIAYPSYQDSIMRSRRADAKGVLMTSASALEKRFSETGSYCEPAGCQTVATDRVTPTVGSPKSPIDGNDTYYDIRLNASGKTSYTLYAIPANAQNQDKCGTLTITEAGVRDILNPPEASVTKNDCW
ncbi:MAG: hypothetical protein RL637_1447 [Pseudomonadota bacterium]|jgi:type IV pilus assembly protein PilE